MQSQEGSDNAVLRDYEELLTFAIKHTFWSCDTPEYEGLMELLRQDTENGLIELLRASKQGGK